MSWLAEFLLKIGVLFTAWFSGLQQGKRDSDLARMQANEQARRLRDEKEREVAALDDVEFMRRKSRWLRRPK